MDTATRLIMLFFVGCLVVLAVTHSGGFATSFGSLFGGINALGQTLTGTGGKA